MQDLSEPLRANVHQGTPKFSTPIRKYKCPFYAWHRVWDRARKKGMKRMSGHCLWMEEADIKHVTPPIVPELLTAVNAAKKVQGVTWSLPQAGDFRGGTPRRDI